MKNVKHRMESLMRNKTWNVIEHQAPLQLWYKLEMNAILHAIGSIPNTVLNSLIDLLEGRAHPPSSDEGWEYE